jgi:type IV pilus secretin PilQ/predicted competence protein
MNVQNASHRPSLAGRAVAVAGVVGTVVALTAGNLTFAASGAPVRLVSVSAQSNTVLIEASEPAAYTVTRPDALTLIIDLRDVSVSDAASRVQPQGAVAAVKLDQARAADGVAVARVRLTLARATEYTVKSARNTIRLELGAPAPTSARSTQPPLPVQIPSSSTAAVPVEASAYLTPPAAAAPAPATAAIERVRTTRTAGSAIVTISGTTNLAPTGISESRELPRRLILDFPNVSSRAAAQTQGDGELVRRVRVNTNSQSPLVTRVTMEIAEGATYSLQRGTVGTRDVAVVIHPARPSAKAEATLAAEERISAPAAAKSSTNGEAIAALKTVPAAQPSSPAPTRNNIAARSQQQEAASGGPQQPPAPVPPAAPSTSQGQQFAVGQEKKYTGHPVSMDFQGADLRSVLRTFAEISGLNMVIDPDVQGSVDIVLTDVPWDQALEVILRGNQLDYTVDGTIVRIAKVETLRKEQDARTMLAQSAAQAGALAVRTFTLSYAKADQAAPLVRTTVLSQRGTVQVDPRTNTLIITDLPGRLDTVSQLLTTLDRAEPQVEIEARIITTTREFARALGVQWGFNGRVNSDIGNTTNMAFPNNGSLGGRVGSQQPNDVRGNPLDATASAVNLGVGDATSALGLALGSINGAFNLDVALSALERTGKGRILSTPRVTTQNNIAAEITQGVQIPVQTVANETVTVTFKDAALSLKVTPQITAANTVIMQISVENSSPGQLVQIADGTIPSIDTQRAITRVQVNDGTTTVLGGIFVSREQNTNDKTPALHRIPFLGWLFKRNSQVDESRELLIFITPRIQKG